MGRAEDEARVRAELEQARRSRVMAGDHSDDEREEAADPEGPAAQ